MLKLRSYQQDAVDSVFSDFAAGFRKVMVVASTGSGKTIIFWSIVDKYLKENPGARILVVANMQDLVDQAEEKLFEFFPKLALSAGVVMNVKNEVFRQIVIASVQTLNVEGRMDEVLHYGPIDFVITDECHEALSDGFAFVYDKVEESNPDWRHLGVTATPKRADGRGMKELYEKTSIVLDIGTLVKMKALVRPYWLGIQTGISIKEIRMAGKDLDAEALANVFEVDNCFDLVVETHRKYADGRKALAFVCSVKGAYKLAEKFRQAGYKAIAADAETPKGTRPRADGKLTRPQIIANTRAGEYDVVVNVGLWTKGFDAPIIDCIHMVRPTKHDGAYLQMIGRGMRLFPGKKDVLVLDYAPVEFRDLVFAGDVLGMKIRKDAYTKEVEAGEVFSGFVFDGEDTEYVVGDPANLIARQLDYMESTGFQWSGSKGGWLTVGLGQGKDEMERVLAISPPGEVMTLYGLAKEKGEYNWTVYEIMSGDSDQVLTKAEELASKWENPLLARKKRGWRTQPCSPDLERYATKLGIFRPGMSKGECSDAVTRKLALHALKRYGLPVDRELADMKFLIDKDPEPVTLGTGVHAVEQQRLQMAELSF